jgi:short-subunit dehydrogenase
MDLHADPVAVVTGASGGVGKAIAQALAKTGATLCLVGRNLESLGAGVEEVCVRSSQVRCYRTDLTVDEDIHSLKDSLAADFGCVDILIHSAGVISLGRIEDASIGDFERQYKTNVRAPYALTQALLPLIKVRRGQIVFINSSVGLSAKANLGSYAATKHALKAVADSLREEVNTNEVRVLSLFLGRTATSMQAAVHAIEGKTYHPELLLQPDDVASVVINALSLPRTAEVTDISMRPLIKSY